jgi:hypothetical protein
MIIVAAWILVIAHPGFAFKGNETLIPREEEVKAESYESP